MKLLVVSHACVTPINQSFFEEVENLFGWQVTIVTPSTWQTEYGLRKAERWPSFRGGLVGMPAWKSGNIPLHSYKTTFLPLLRSVSPDAIYVHHEAYGLATAQVYAANRIAGRVPIGFYAAQNILKRYPWPFRSSERMVLQHSDFSFPVTNGALDVLRAKGYLGAAEVLPLAVDRRIYYPRVDEAADIRRKLGLSRGEVLLGYVGRFVEEKGLLNLMNAFAQLKDLSWRCVLVGSGPQEAELRARIGELGLEQRISFSGYVEHTEVPKWLSSLDVLVLPSETRGAWKEQFGRVLVEANACGACVLGTRSGEIPAVIEKMGGGVLVEERDPEGMADALRRLIQNPKLRADLSQQGMQSAATLYDQRHLAAVFAKTIIHACQRT